VKNLTPDEIYIQRCFDLAKRGGKAVRSNPNVGALLVHNKRIIAEGWHQKFGSDHAEVNCLNAIDPINKALIQDSTLYISLEPCSYFGKTPACTDLILKNKIPRVVISTTDPNPEVNGQGIEILRKHGVKVSSGVLEEKGLDLIRPFTVNQQQKRPYIILKIVKSTNHFIGKAGERIWLSNRYSTILSHKWRAEVDGIMVGTNTVLNDDPALDTRLFPGDSPTRIIADRKGVIPQNAKVFDGKTHTILIREKNGTGNSLKCKSLELAFEGDNYLEKWMKALFDEGIYVLLIEGGSKLIKSFLKHKLWDEARIIHTSHPLNEGIKAPNITGKLMNQIELDSDRYYQIYNT